MDKIYDQSSLIPIILIIPQVNGVRSENGGVYRCLVETPEGSFHGDFVFTIQSESLTIANHLSGINLDLTVV